MTILPASQKKKKNDICLFSSKIKKLGIYPHENAAYTEVITVDIDSV